MPFAEVFAPAGGLHWQLGSLKRRFASRHAIASVFNAFNVRHSAEVHDDPYQHFGVGTCRDLHGVALMADCCLAFPVCVRLA